MLLASTHVQTHTDWRLMEKPDEKENADFTIIEKIVMVLFWVQTLKYDTDLKVNGYSKKYRSRRFCIFFGIVLYSLIIVFAIIQ